LSFQGSTYSIVPYVCPKATGSVAGLVGAGGNLGGVVFLVMIQEWNYRPAFEVMAVCVICSAFLSFFISIRGYDGILFGNTTPEEVDVVTGECNVHKEEALDNFEVDEHKTTATSADVPAAEKENSDCKRSP
jgi:NNP family nitrate/nitrite transporter-like MFS transporter